MYVAAALGIVFIVVLFLIISYLQAPNFEVYQLEMGGGKTYEIKYSIEGSNVQSIEACPESFTMVIDIEEADESGALKVQFNRSDMAELLGNEGQEVSAFVDKKGSTIAIGSAQDTVTVTVDFQNGSKVIELIGAKYN